MRSLRNALFALFPALIVCSLPGLPVAAQTVPKADPDRSSPIMARDPAAIALRDRVVKSYHGLTAIHEKVRQRQWAISPDDALTIEIEFRYRRPNRLYLSVDYPNVGKPGRWQLVYACDGKRLTVYNGALNEYQSARGPAHLDRLVLPQALRGPEFAALLREASPFDELEKGAIVQYGEAFQTGESGTWRTLKLDLQQDGAHRTLTYRISPQDYLIHGLDLAIVPNSDAASPFVDPEVRSHVDAVYTLVDTHPRFTDDDFRFTPPAGAHEQRQSAPDKSRARAARGGSNP